MSAWEVEVAGAKTKMARMLATVMKLASSHFGRVTGRHSQRPGREQQRSCCSPCRELCGRTAAQAESRVPLGCVTLKATPREQTTTSTADQLFYYLEAGRMCEGWSEKRSWAGRVCISEPESRFTRARLACRGLSPLFSPCGDFVGTFFFTTSCRST